MTESRQCGRRRARVPWSSLLASTKTSRLRKAALAAGAKRVLSYNKLFSDGPAVVARLIEGTL